MTINLSNRLENARILIYSHDTFGLGHLRRCRAIAHQIVERYKGVSVLIISGSPVIGSFEFKARVDFIRIPGVIKLQNGDYTSLSLHIDLSETLAIREAIIRQTAKVYAPDLFIVDKEPLGLHGEVRNTLYDLKSRGVSTVLGLRDVLDDQEALLDEWVEKQVFPNLDTLYDEIWIYGVREFYQPLKGLPLEASISAKTVYTGYLQRLQDSLSAGDPILKTPYLLITPGGGRDGAELVELVVSAYMLSAALPYHAVIVLGPFMHTDDRVKFHKQTEGVGSITLLDFYPRMESLIEGAAGMITMGGYNTFCEILSYDKPALVFPRVRPRTEQLIRCQRADELGMLTMLDPDTTTVAQLTEYIEKFDSLPLPSSQFLPGMLEGMNTISQRMVYLLPHERIRPIVVDTEKGTNTILN
jgi:predicted glycosyltransferase